jgi:hypothetical protein
LWDLKFKEQIHAQHAYWKLYFENSCFFVARPKNVLTIIHDKMDQSKTMSLHFFYKNKNIDSLMRLPISVIGMIAHGYGDIWYAYYNLELYLSESSHYVDLIAKLLRDLEGVTKFASCSIFPSTSALILFDTLLDSMKFASSLFHLIQKNPLWFPALKSSIRQCLC